MSSKLQVHDHIISIPVLHIRLLRDLQIQISSMICCIHMVSSSQVVLMVESEQIAESMGSSSSQSSDMSNFGMASVNDDAGCATGDLGR